MKITIEIDTENDSFQDSSALHELETIMNRVRWLVVHNFPLEFEFPLRDINGNTVGKVICE